MDNHSLNTVFNIFRTHNIILYILLLSSSVITFDILGLRKVLGIEELGQPYLAIIGILFIISLAGFMFVLFNGLFGGLKEAIQRYYEEKKFKKELNGLIENLTDKEIVILSLYIIEDANTIWLPMQAPETTSLVSKKLIFMASKYGRNMSNGMIIFHYSIDKDVKERFEIFLSELFTDPWKDNFENFFTENKPSYLNVLSRAKSLWEIS